ncbi:MAG: phosphomannomutase [Spirochaeta sp. LUC14_002_19_P3]|nr:MAG: phosphomannomutase [Spirochaeta sp. LUC14_002_19_P3]
MNNDIMEKAKIYLELEENSAFRDEVKQLLEAKDVENLNDRFWRDLDFGTGGLRGVIGGGFNRINTYTIRKATKGLANYIVYRVPEKERKAVISFDSRRYSDLFALEAARVLAASGIQTWLFNSLRPTPMLSYAVRQLGACAGIMVTASHNPAKYNGYKVYWSDGAQVVPPHDKGIIAEVNKVSGRVEAMDAAQAKAQGLIQSCGSDMDRAYGQMVIGQSINPALFQEKASAFKIVYTPLHGAGTVPVETIFEELGMKVITVPQQREPDGDFPTVEYPNPEIAPALALAIELAKKEKANLVMATDPDADRLGIAVPEGSGWSLISGNRLGALLADYIFRISREQGQLPTNPAFINTIVTSEIQNRIAEYHGATSFRVLTGFKYIGEKIRQFEADNRYSYVFGCEESYGYLAGTSVRDKDAVSTAVLSAEMALWNNQRGKSIPAHLEELWDRFGYYDELLISRDFEGQQGQKIMNGMMESLRSNPPGEIGSIRVETMRDFSTGTSWNAENNKTEKNIDLPSSNVLQFVLSDGSLITARPSGTEPKIKFYASCRSDKGNDIPAARRELQQKFAAIESWINTLIGSQA